MELTHRFTVPTGVEETWAHFNDIASVAECFPGAPVTSADGDSFAGSVKVKLGPIALVYNGTGTFVEKDEAAHRFVVDAKGKDKRGNGTAGAKVTVVDEPTRTAPPTSTVLTDLAITGKPAQFGRGVMQDVSDKLLGQFVACLEQRLTGGGAEAPDDVRSRWRPRAGPAAAADDGPPAARQPPAIRLRGRSRRRGPRSRPPSRRPSTWERGPARARPGLLEAGGRRARGPRAAVEAAAPVILPGVGI